jgi:hypothetical protein
LGGRAAFSCACPKVNQLLRVRPNR